MGSYPTVINLNSANPPAPTGLQNVVWNSGPETLATVIVNGREVQVLQRDVSASVVGTFVTPSGDAKQSYNATMGANSSTLVLLASYPTGDPQSPDQFSPGDVGKKVRYMAPLGDNSDRISLDGTILSVIDSTHATMSFTAPSQGISYGSVFWFDSAQDDTANIQAAINLGGKVVLGPGVFVYSNALTYSPNLRVLEGAGPLKTTLVLNSNTNESLAVYFTDCTHLLMQDLGVFGPGINESYGGGIWVSFNVQSNVERAIFRNIILEEAAGYGIYLNTPILCEMDNVKVVYVAGRGVYLNGGVSCSLRNVYSLTCLESAFYLSGCFDCTLDGCAAEASGAEYEFVGCTGCSAVGCDAEAGVNRVPLPGVQVNPTASSGGSVAPGTYYFMYTWVRQLVPALSLLDETTASLESTQLTVTLGNQTISATIPAAPDSTITQANIYITPTNGASGTEGYVETISVTPSGTTSYTRSTSVTPGAPPPFVSYRGHGWIVSGSSCISIRDFTSNTLPSTDARHVWIGNGSKLIKVEGFAPLSNPVLPTYNVEVSSQLGEAASSGVRLTNCNLSASSVLGNLAWWDDNTGLSQSISLGIGGIGGPTWIPGNGAPSTTPPVGSLYSRLDGSPGSTLYLYTGGSWHAVA